MLRILRIAGIIVFALVLGYAAHSLQKMYKSGRLFEQYNSERKAGITMLAFSMIALGTLGSFEMRNLRKYAKMRRYGDRRYADADSSKVDDKVNTSIYDTPRSVDDWQNRRLARNRPRRHKPAQELPETWMKVLRIVCTTLPVAYLAIFAVLYIQGIGQSAAKWIYPSLCVSYCLVAVVVAIGVCLRKRWGLSTGYLLAILNLVIFPVGTAIGLVLLICLVGASTAFVHSSKPQSRVHGFI